MEDRKLGGRRNGAIGTASLVALVAIAGLIALMIWQPWNSMAASRSPTTTTQLGSPR